MGCLCSILSEYDKKNLCYITAVTNIYFFNKIGLACCGAKVVGAAVFSILGSVMSGISLAI
jgi:hypothetical protein